MFDGKVAAGTKVDLGGRGHGRHRARGAAEESRAEFVKRQHKEREARERKRARDQAATRIQAVYRAHHCLVVARAGHRQVFDKRQADIVKVGTVLPADKKAKFVFHALMPMMRLFAFFFQRREDESRLAAMQELFFSSAVQPLTQGCNICQLAVSTDDAQRRSFLALFEKLLTALLTGGCSQDAARLLLALQAAVSPQALANAGGGTNGPSLAAAAVGQVLRRSEVLRVLTSDVLPKLVVGEQGGLQAPMLNMLDLVRLCVEGAAACVTPARQSLLALLLSAPRLGETLCEVAAQPVGAQATARECFHQLGGALAAHPETIREAVSSLPNEEIMGASRQVWLLRGLVAVLEHFVSIAAQGSSAEPNLSVCLGWLCTAKELSRRAAAPTALSPSPPSATSTATASPMPPAAATETSVAAETERRLHHAAFVRSLLQVVDRRSADALFDVCRLYFDSEEGEPSTEFLQTLAFATPLAERLYPTLDPMLRSAAKLSDDMLEALVKPEALASPEALRLRVFCTVYALQLQPMYDYEFFGPANPLRLEEVERLALFLNQLTFQFVTVWPDRKVLPPASKALRTSLTSLLATLYNRHCRRPILQPPKTWIIPNSRLFLRRAPGGVVDLGGTDEGMQGDDDLLDDDRMDIEEAGHALGRAASPMAASMSIGPANGADALPHSNEYSGSQVLEAVLEEIPHVLPFQDRVALLHSVILADQDKRRDSRSPWAQASMRRHQIRRNYLVEDAFAAFEELDDAALRDIFRVEFIAPDGSQEQGVDGGGLFKEFMIIINRAMFDPNFGLFSATTEDQTLYPAASAFRVHERATDLYTFVGKVVGKSIYEMFLLEPQFCRVFLNKILGRTNEVDDVAALDKELHRNMLRIKECGNVEDLNLTFSVTIAEQGYCEEVDLIPNGRNVPVTKAWLTKYFHLMANFKTNVQIKRHVDAFLKGLQCVIPLSWLRMFDPYELNILISGSNAGFDPEDLRHHTVYHGGYQEDSPVVMWLWQVLQSMSAEDRGRFLMFATSCSRAPLLGFKTLYPKFCVSRVPDGERLPTASTCANLLKLPDYISYEVLKSKLTQAIHAEAGFDLS